MTCIDLWLVNDQLNFERSVFPMKNLFVQNLLNNRENIGNRIGLIRVFGGTWCACVLLYIECDGTRHNLFLFGTGESCGVQTNGEFIFMKVPKKIPTKLKLTHVWIFIITSIRYCICVCPLVSAFVRVWYLLCICVCSCNNSKVNTTKASISFYRLVCSMRIIHSHFISTYTYANFCPHWKRFFAAHSHQMSFPILQKVKCYTCYMAVHTMYMRLYARA